MINSEELYDISITETARLTIGEWSKDDKETMEADFKEFVSDITKCFFEEDGFSTSFVAIMSVMKNTDTHKIPIASRVEKIINVALSVVFSQRYKNFPSPGDMAMAYQDFREQFHKDAEQRKNELMDL